MRALGERPVAPAEIGALSRSVDVGHDLVGDAALQLLFYSLNRSRSSGEAVALIRAISGFTAAFLGEKQVRLLLDEGQADLLGEILSASRARAAQQELFYRRRVEDVEAQMQTEYKVGEGEEAVNIDELRQKLDSAHQRFARLAERCAAGFEAFEGFGEQAAKIFGWKSDNALLHPHEFGSGVVLRFCQKNQKYCARVAGFACWTDTEREQLERFAAQQ